MTTGSVLDLDLRHALGAGPSQATLRPSVLRSEFFFDYSIKRILDDPEQAWFDLAHTRGIGGKSVKAIAEAIANEIERSFGPDCARARELLAQDQGDGRQHSWPVGNIMRFIAVWLPKGAASSTQHDR
jgi:hypothetical protein